MHWTASSITTPVPCCLVWKSCKCQTTHLRHSGEVGLSYEHCVWCSLLSVNFPTWPTISPISHWHSHRSHRWTFQKQTGSSLFFTHHQFSCSLVFASRTLEADTERDCFSACILLKCTDGTWRIPNAHSQLRMLQCILGSMFWFHIWTLHQVRQVDQECTTFFFGLTCIQGK